MRVYRRQLVFFLCLVMLSSTAMMFWTDAGQQVSAQEENQPVYIIPIRDTIEIGLFRFLERAVREAEEADAREIILQMSTLGGSLDAAFRIGELLQNTSVPTTVFIVGRAASAGSFIALSADRIVMRPGSSIGSASIVTIDGERVSNPKTDSYWFGEMRAAARSSGRNPDIAQAMADESIVVDMEEQIGRTKQEGEILALDYEEAFAVGYADFIASNLSELLVEFELSGYPLVETQETRADRIARFLTHPVTATVLLLIGLAGIALELFVPGFGIPGLIGLTALGLYFFGNFVSGFAGVEAILLFLAGCILLAIEFFVPSFGIFGGLGILTIFISIVMAADDAQQGMLSLGIAIVLTAVIVTIAVKYFGIRGVWKQFVLADVQRDEEGYQPSASRSHLKGLEGVTITSLRPAGTALIDDNRIDVVSSGEYIAAGKPIRVTTVDSNRVIVREVTPKQVTEDKEEE